MSPYAHHRPGPPTELARENLLVADFPVRHVVRPGVPVLGPYAAQ